jgi:tetratricopeptide (TPR) repeat protein
MRLRLALLGLLICTEAVLLSAARGQAIAPNVLDPNFKPKSSTPATPVLNPALPAEAGASNISPAIQAAFDSGAYSQVAKLGAALLVQQPTNTALRLMVANSLAWSGRTDAAFDQYEKLLTSPLAAAAQVGQANLLRWRGQPEQAEVLYDKVLKQDPANVDAKEGKRLGDRQLRGQWLKTYGFGKDSSNFRRLEGAATYKSVTQDRALRWNLGYVLGRDIGAPEPNKYAEINGSAKWLNLPLAPKIDLSVADGFNKTRLYGLVTVEPFDGALSLRAGYINWGRRAFNTAAQAAHLAAKQIGSSAQWQSGFGELRLRGDYYLVADNNRVWDAEAVLTPAWQPLPADFRWYTGLYNKKAKRADSRYWTPVGAYTLGLLGIKKAWYFEQGDLSVGLQGGFKLSDEAKNNIGLSASGKYWVNDGTALGFELWSSNSPRQTDYKQHFFNFNLQRLW